MATSEQESYIPGRGAAIAPTRVDAEDLVGEVIWSRVYERDPSAVKKARFVAQAVVASLRREGLLNGTKPADADEVMEAVRQRAAKMGQAPIRGISHLMAEALVLLDLPTVHRDTIEALMPKFNDGSINKAVSMQFKRSLRKFNNWKWIDRSDDGLITILDRDALVKWFTMAVDLNERRATKTLNLAGAVARLNAQLASGDIDEQRRRELLAMKRVMESAPGAVTNARGAVRVVPKSTAL